MAATLVAVASPASQRTEDQQEGGGLADRAERDERPVDRRLRRQPRVGGAEQQDEERRESAVDAR